MNTNHRPRNRAARHARKRTEIAAAAALLAIAGCTYSLPVVGELDGEPAQGTSVVSAAEGRFTVTAVSGLSCSGTHSSTDTSVTITAQVTCNDGQTGTALITRKSNFISGTAVIRLSGGRTGRFVFGDLSYGEEFG